MNHVILIIHIMYVNNNHALLAEIITSCYYVL